MKESKGKGSAFKLSTPKESKRDSCTFGQAMNEDNADIVFVFLLQHWEEVVTQVDVISFLQTALEAELIRCLLDTLSPLLASRQVLLNVGHSEDS